MALFTDALEAFPVGPVAFTVFTMEENITLLVLDIFK
jgi:hypothetical protein